MDSNRRLFEKLQRLALVLACAGMVSLPANAQSAAVATDAATLAKYDKNKNGKLDADELAAMQSDQAKAAKAVTTTTDAAAGEKVVELSPFEVSGSEDRGYSASNTLAGTRLNSKLEDISGSVSVVTKQQLLDTASLDINDIFLYETGTEGTGQFTDLTNDGRGEGVWDNVTGNPTGANRMRGLSSANVAVGGFTSSSTIPIDTYNVDAVEIARGPNSQLAGLSDAGGTVNLVTSRANVSRDTTQVQTRFDNWGGIRASLDLNRPIIKNMLSLRISAVYNETGYVRKPSVDRTNRQQIAFTFKPFKTTTLNGSFESFHEFAQRANSITPRDTITVWKSRGSPSWDPITRLTTVNGVTGTVPITNAAQMPLGMSGIGSSNARVLQYIDDGAIQYMMRGANVANATVGTTTFQQFTQSSSDNVAGPLYKLPGSNNKAIYDWTDVNMAASGIQIQRAAIMNLSLDQGLINTQRNRLDLNVAWRREDQSDYRRQFIGQLDGVGTTLEIDTNAKLLDGRPNPFFLRPFIGGVNPQSFKKPVFNDSYRWQMAYQLDLRHEKNLFKWLGMHRAIAYQEYGLNIQAPSNLRYHDIITDNRDFQPGLTGTGNVTGNAGALFYPLYYFGKTQGGGVQYANTGPVHADGKFNASFLSTTATAWNLADPVTIQEVYFALGQQKKKVRTYAANVQSFLVNDQVITNFGLRKDRAYTEDNIGTPTVNNFIDETNLYNFGLNKRWRKGDTKTQGYVVKPFRGFSFLERTAEQGSGLPRFLAQTLRGFNVHYNKSDSFKPADTAYNLYLQELPNPSGQSEEYGFSLNMFDNRFSMRLTHQKTMQVHTRAGTGVIATRALAIDFDNSGQNLSFGLFDAATSWWQQINPTWTLDQAQTKAATDMGLTVAYINSVAGKSISDANDALSQGWELELQFNPTRYWTLKATGNQQEAIDSNISLFMQQFINERLPLWTTIKIPTNLLPDGSQLTNAGANWWTTSQGSNGMPVNYFTGNVQTPLNLAITTQGKKKPQTREFSFNVITNYQLAGLSGDHKWLKNATIGGAYRWASKGAIGYYAGAPDPDGVVRTLDKTKPYYDKPTGNLDLNMSYRTKLFNNRISTRFQLNIKNATESGHLQGIAVNPDGQFWQYRIIDPRQFILTTTFDL